MDIKVDTLDVRKTIITCWPHWTSKSKIVKLISPTKSRWHRWDLNPQSIPFCAAATSSCQAIEREFQCCLLILQIRLWHTTLVNSVQQSISVLDTMLWHRICGARPRSDLSCMSPNHIQARFIKSVYQCTKPHAIFISTSCIHFPPLITVPVYCVGCRE